jgi:hypothetical protein
LTKLILLEADFTKFISNVIKNIHICVSCNPAVTGHSVAYKFREIKVGRKITASFGNVTVRGEKRWKGQGGSMMAKSLSEHV